MSLLLLALAIAPGVAIMLYIYEKDKYEKEPLRLLVKCFFGGVLSTIPAIALSLFGGWLGFGISENSLNTFIYAFAVVGFSEEFCKYIAVKKIAYHHPAFNEPFDGIVYCVMVSMGFATLENILYVIDGGMTTAMLRMFTAVPAHATFGIIMGFFMGEAKFLRKNEILWNLAGLGGAILFHGAYDYFLFEMNYPGIAIGAFVSLIVAIVLSKKAIRMHQEKSPFRII